MPGGKLVTAPDGTRWRVRRRWLDRSAPKLWRRPRLKGDSDTAGWIPDALAGGIDSPAGLAIVAALIVALALIVFVLLPLIGIVLELILLGLLLTSGLFGRVVLRRPWTIEAVSVEDPARRSAFTVTGWRRSRRALAALATAVETTGPPSALPEAEPLALAAPERERMVG